jgi:hypothetical protein
VGGFSAIDRRVPADGEVVGNETTTYVIAVSLRIDLG